MQAVRSEPPRRVGAVAVLSLVAVVSLLPACQLPNPMLRQQADYALQEDNVDYADQRITLALKADPGDWKALYWRGVIRLKQDRPLEAKIALERALTLRDSNEETADINDAMAEALFCTGDIASLQAFLKDATDRYGRPHDYIRQAKYLGKINDADGAKVAFRKAARFAAPDDPSPYLGMADYYESIGDTDNAVTALRRAYGIQPTNPTIQKRLRKLGMIPGPTVAMPLDRGEDQPAPPVVTPVATQTGDKQAAAPAP